ncbi:MAG: DUF192 domain-containing protein [Haloarculaceae archaeon]
MRVLHEPDPGAGADAGGGQRTSWNERAPRHDGASARVLATAVERPASALAHAKGLRFRRELPEDYAFVMDVGRASSLPLLGGPRWTVVDMLFVHVPLDVLWLVDGEVVGTKRLRPWTGVGAGKADTIVELPAGAASDVTAGDTVRVVEAGDDGAPGDTGAGS